MHFGKESRRSTAILDETYQILIFGGKMIKSGCRLTQGVDTLILPKLGGASLG